MEAIILSIATGFAASLAAPFCLKGIQNPEDARLFGKIHWSVIGLIGYTLIFTAIITGLEIATFILASVAGLVTIWLISIAYKKKLWCAACVLAWIANTSIVLLVFTGSAHIALP